MPAPRSTNKHDVALATARGKGDRDALVARGFVIAVVALAAAVPIHEMQGIVQPLAGRTTTVHVNFVVSITIALSLMGNGFQYLKGRSQRSELKRQRDRLEALEGGGT